MGSFTSLHCHIIFGTKYRRKLIHENIRERMYEYIGGIIRGQNGCLLEIGGVEDHIHILASLSPTMAVSSAIREIKANSSKWINELPGERERFEWQKGYGAFSVSHSLVPTVRRYIVNQLEHHRVKPFQEEFEEFLKRHGIDYEPRSLFEGEHHG